MIRSLICVCMTILVLNSPSIAGVVLEMGAKDLKTGKEKQADKVFAQDGMIRVDSLREGKQSMIFREGSLWMINHEKKNYYKVDPEAIERMSNQLGDAMKQMEEQLAKLPPEQRKMMEKMITGKMKEAMGGQAGENLTMRVESMGSGKWEQYSCNKYAIYWGKEKESEICAAPLNEVEGAAEMEQAFRSMAEYLSKMLQAFQKGPFANLGKMASSPLHVMDEIDGIPVHVTRFDNGQPTEEEYLKSASSQNLDAALFSPPKDYKAINPFQKQ